MSSSVLTKLIEENEWVDIPSKITTREGHAIDTSSSQWHLPYSMRAHATLDFNEIINSSLRWVTKRYIQEKIQITSTHAGYSNFQDIKREFLRFQNNYGLLENLSKMDIESKLISIIEHRISLAREKHRLWALYRPIQQVYFEVAGNIVEHLDKASAKGFAKYLDFFKGHIINNADEAINGHRNDKHLSFINETNPIDQTEIGVCGENNICHLDPPFSCYLCPKFQPYRHANHEHVLDCLLSSRDTRMKKYESARLGIQLDDVIFAVAQVAEQCKSEASNG